MQSTADCCDKISREHWLSRSILKTFGELRGFWRRDQELGQTKFLKPNLLVRKILCKRHNSSLSKLDTAAGDAFNSLERALQHLKNPNANRKRDRTYIIDGTAIELWSLKVLIGAHHSGVLTSNGLPTQTGLTFDLPAAVQVLTTGTFPPGGGFYLLKDLGRSSAVSLSALENQSGELVGIRISLHELTYCVALEPLPATMASPEAHRIKLLRLGHKDFSSAIAFAFDEFQVGDAGMFRELSFVA